MRNKRSHTKRRSSSLLTEWRSLLSNKILLISMTVIMFIPIMYGGFFLGSIWDPYGKMSQVPVAFVNEDEGAILRDKQIAIGRDIEAALRKNHDIGWEFVDQAAAERGVRDGHYYAVITVPKEFSRRVASVTDEQPKQAILQYTVTPSKNYIGALVSNQAAEKVKSTVSQQITEAYAEGILGAIDTIGEGLSAAADGADQLTNGARQITQGTMTYTSGVQTLATNQQTLHVGLQQLQRGSTQLQQGLTQLQQGLPSQQQITQLTTGLDQLQAGIAQLHTQVSRPSPAITEAQQSLATEAASLQQSLAALQSSQSAYATVMQRATAAVKTTGQVTLSADDVVVLATFGEHTNSTAKHSVKLMTQLQKLNQLVAQQQATLRAGVGQLHTASQQLLPPTAKAVQGYTAVHGATTRLLNGGGQLTDGITRAEQGSGQLVHGAYQLTDATPRLLHGVQAVGDGSATLADKLRRASRQVALQPTAAATQTQIAAPVTTQEEARGTVPNYGYALSPYVLSLGLFVGALVVNVIYPIRQVGGRRNTVWQQLLAKASVVGAAAIMQATIVIVIMTTTLGLHPEHMPQFMLAIYLTSLTYMAIVTALVVMLDNPGRFLAMLLLVLQLGASEGTFPLQTAPQFFQAMNPFLPMTYSIHALRQAISGGIGNAMYWRGLGALGVFAAIAILAWLGYLWYCRRRREQSQ